ncbi:MAG TPA: hypothetical protein VMV41_10120 [Cellulomonadaceae bacterium]|nr:hypothetical protein [Cellulomonadaceae bacterium]
MTTYDTSLSLATERHDAEREAAQAAADPTPQAIRDAEDRVDRMAPGDPRFTVCTCDLVTCHGGEAGAWWASATDAIAMARLDWQGHLPHRAHLVTETTTVTAIAA